MGAVSALPALHEGLGHCCFSDAENHGKHQLAQVTGTPSLALKSSTGPRASGVPDPGLCREGSGVGSAGSRGALVAARGRRDAGGQKGKHPPAYKSTSERVNGVSSCTGRGRYSEQGSSGSSRPQSVQAAGTRARLGGKPWQSGGGCCPFRSSLLSVSRLTEFINLIILKQNFPKINQSINQSGQPPGSHCFPSVMEQTETYTPQCDPSVSLEGGVSLQGTVRTAAPPASSCARPSCTPGT